MTHLVRLALVVVGVVVAGCGEPPDVCIESCRAWGEGVEYAEGDFCRSDPFACQCNQGTRIEVTTTDDVDGCGPRVSVRREYDPPAALTDERED